MDLGTLVSELFYEMIYLVTRPFFVCMSACLFFLRSVFIVSYVTVDMVSTSICFHINMFWRALLGMVWLLMLPILVPIQFLTSIPRERQLEQFIHEMQFEVENLKWERKDIEQNLQAAVKEYQLMESELAELEEEHYEAMSKIEKLEAELQDLKDENIRLKAIQGKGYCHADPDKDPKSASTHGTSVSESSHDQDITNLKPLRMKNNSHGLERKIDHSSFYPCAATTIPKGEATSEVSGPEREIAFSRSIFSAVLSLLVGVIIHEAKEEELCMPLVVALFMVVGISLRSVVRFFSTVKTGPASDAVALLSLNWFILGTLTYPTLPRIAKVLGPRVRSVTGPVFSSLGASVH